MSGARRAESVFVAIRLTSALLALSMVVVFAACSPGSADTARSSASASAPTPAQMFGAIEARDDVTLGVYAVDTASGRVVEYRPDERFGFASTIKAFAVAAVLDAVPASDRDRQLPVMASDLVPYSPVMEQHVGGSVSILEAMDAATRSSDNTSANLLFGVLGGPEALQQRLRDAGDDTTMVDRTEPLLNEFVPGDDRDTSTARALATSLEAFALGDELDREDRALLIGMMEASTTGFDLIRAGAPDGWEVADASGAAEYGIRTAIAIAWPPDGGPPVVLAVLTKRSEREAAFLDPPLADATDVVFAYLASEE